MFFNETDYTLVSNLKGRVSKALNVSSALKEADKKYLEAIYIAIDDLLLSGSDLRQQIKSKYTLTKSSEALKETKEFYIKKHILPIISKICTKSWGKNG